MTTNEFLAILQAYGYSVVPLDAWQTADIVRMIELLDSELQRRADEDSSDDDPDPFANIDEEHDMDWDDDYV